MENKKILYLCLFSLMALNLISLTNSLANFTVDIKRKDKMCFHDTYSEQTLIVLNISSYGELINVFVRDPEQKKIHEKNSVMSFKDSFTTFTGGNYEFCITNPNKENIEVLVDIRSGIAAKDFSQVPKVQDLQPIERDLMMIEEYSKEVKKLTSFFNTHQKSYDSLQESIVMNISYFSIIIIVIILVLGVLETVISRQIVVSRKKK